MCKTPLRVSKQLLSIFAIVWASTDAIDGWADASVLVNAAGMNSPGAFTDIPKRTTTR